MKTILLILLASPAFAEFTPLPSADPNAIDVNFKRIEEELRASTGTNIFTSGIQFGDGTVLTSTSGIITSNSVTITSAALFNLQTPAVTPSGLCLTGSTIAWTSNGRLTRVYYSGEMQENGTAVEHMLVLVDGAIISPQTTSKFAQTVTSPGAFNSFNMSFDFDILPAAGVHQACLIAECDGASGANCLVAPASAGEFGIIEIAGGPSGPIGPTGATGATGATGSSGSSILPTNNTWTGTNVYQSSTTVGSSAVFSSTMNHAAVVFGVPTTVAYSSFTNATAITLTNFISSYTYTVSINIHQNTSNGQLRAQFDGDTSAGDYQEASNGTTSSNAGCAVFNNGTLAYVPLSGADLIEQPWTYQGRFNITTDPSLGRGTAMITGLAAYRGQNDTVCAISIGGMHYGPSTPFTKVYISDSAGTMTGFIEVQAVVQSAGYQ